MTFTIGQRVAIPNDAVAGCEGVIERIEGDTALVRVTTPGEFENVLARCFLDDLLSVHEVGE
jgi:hypothetical protein